VGSAEAPVDQHGTLAARIEAVEIEDGHVVEELVLLPPHHVGAAVDDDHVAPLEVDHAEQQVHDAVADELARLGVELELRVER
jgi:hypothetical protein